MKLNILDLTRKVGESTEDYRERVKNSLKKVLNDSNAPQSTGKPDCQCPICQLKRGIGDLIDKEGSENAKETLSAVSKAAREVMLEGETQNYPPYLLDDNKYSFSQILESMKNGYRVIRGDWPGVMSIGIVNERGDNAGQPVACESHIAQLISIDNNDLESYHYMLPYQLTNEDILATDWRILKYKI